MANDGLGLGLDIGGTRIRAAVVAADGRIVSSRKAAVADRSPEAVVSQAAACAAEAVSAAGRPGLVAAGAAIAGQLRGRTGVVEVAPNLGWRNVAVGELLSARIGLSVRVANDLKAAAWGEYVAGAGRGVDDLLLLFVGSGVGGGFIVAGRLGEGASRVAGEVGHVRVVAGGLMCGCGERGCLEAYAGGRNMVARVREALAAGRVSSLGRCESELTPADVERAALSGDALAEEIWNDAATHLGTALGNLLTVFNPALVILGGGVLAHCPHLKARARDGAISVASAVSAKAARFADPALGDDSGVVGAALLAAWTPEERAAP